MGRKLSDGNGAYQWKGSFPVISELTGEKRFTVVRDLPSRKAISQWEGSFPVKRELTSEMQLLSGKES